MERQRAELGGGRYEVQAVLGCGTSSVVYLARHLELQRDVAIKVLRAEKVAGEEGRAQTLREARIIASMNHPHIVTVHDVGVLVDGRPYMVMEVVQGTSLERIVGDGFALPVERALEVFEQVARALGHAHHHGVVHRDIKPGNILVSEHSSRRLAAKVTDFGVAARAPEQQRGEFVGTPMYMSPEQALGEPVSAASDLYSLGVVMYRVLTGRRPFDVEVPRELAMCHVTQSLPDLCSVARDVPPQLGAAVMRCLEKEPDDRFASADDLIAALQAVHVHPHLGLHSTATLEPFARIESAPGWGLPVRLAAATASGFAVGWVLGWTAGG